MTLSLFDDIGAFSGNAPGLRGFIPPATTPLKFSEGEGGYFVSKYRRSEMSDRVFCYSGESSSRLTGIALQSHDVPSIYLQAEPSPSAMALQGDSSYSVDSMSCQQKKDLMSNPTAVTYFISSLICS